MSSCCGQIPVALSELNDLSKSTIQATEYVQEKQVSVAIYKKAGKFAFCPALIAAQLGYRIIRVVSFHSHPSS